MGDANGTPLQEYELLQNSTCTTCSITIDKSNYWVPDLFYRWPNNTFSLVSSAGLTVYYLARTGTGNQSNPDWKAFPQGLRFVAGNPFRRSFNSSSIEEQAITFACIGGGGPETPGLPEDVSVCVDGLRAQVSFPMCWNGVDLDSPSHTSHMAYPIEMVDNGNCPDSHPVRIPFIFYEVLFSITDFPRQTGYQPYTFACGDDTGYGYHGDFLNGWDHDIVQKTLQDPTCYASSTNNGNNVKACKSLAPYVQDPGHDTCIISKYVYNIEDLGMNHPIVAMPGCNPVTSGPAPAKPCNVITPQPTSGPGWRRFLLQPKTVALFVGAISLYVPLNASAVEPYYSEAWTMVEGNGGWTMQSDLTGLYVTSPQKDALICDKNSPSSWEYFDFIAQGDMYAIRAHSNNMYVSIYPDGTMHADSGTVGDAQLWNLIDPSKYIHSERYPHGNHY
jgi:hypothetical protein